MSDAVPPMSMQDLYLAQTLSPRARTAFLTAVMDPCEPVRDVARYCVNATPEDLDRLAAAADGLYALLRRAGAIGMSTDAALAAGLISAEDVEAATGVRPASGLGMP